MLGFPSIQNAKLDKKHIDKLKQYYSWSAFTIGKTQINVTKTGGIHYTGSRVLSDCVMFEIRRGGGYIIICLFSYPKGVVFHSHIFWAEMDKNTKDGWGKVLENVYEEVKKILLED